MAHHANEPFNSEDNEFMKKFINQDGNPLGPTGKFPEGKLTDNDEGEIKIGITTLKGKIVIDFGKPIHCIGLTKEQAVDIANTLFERARKL